MTADNEMIRRGDARNAVVRSAGAMDAVARIYDLPAVQPGVKPLVWENVVAECTRQKAPALGGHYSVVQFDAGTDEAHYATNIDLGGLAFVFILEPDLKFGGRRPKRFPTLEAAKAAAQADYEARILAALEVQPAPDVAGLVEAAKRSAEGWTNAIELGIILPQHRTSAGILRDELNAALAALEDRG
jgi:hypothetical protein